MTGGGAGGAGEAGAAGSALPLLAAVGSMLLDACSTLPLLAARLGLPLLDAGPSGDGGAGVVGVEGAESCPCMSTPFINLPSCRAGKDPRFRFRFRFSAGAI